MRVAVILAAIAAVAVAETEWSYTGPSYTMTADVYTSSCTDETGTYIGSAYTSGGSWTTSYASASATTAAAGHTYGSSYPAGHSSAGYSWGSSAAPAVSTYSATPVAATPAPSSYTGAANQNAIGAGALAVAGLAMLL
jgi:hypothetical protein